MPFSQPTAPSFRPVPSVFARLQHSIKARMHASSIFETYVPNILTLKRRTSLSSTRMQKSTYISKGAKRRSFLPSLKLSSSSSSSWSSGDSTSSLKPVDSEASAESTILSGIVLAPESPTCVPALPSPPPIGTKIIDRFWPTEDFDYDDRDEVPRKGSLSSPVIVNVLSPPPYHRCSPSAIVRQDNILPSDKYPSHYRDQDDSLPMRFPF
ncbi:hypothetical protein DFH29DRAFT_999987 [Suillus ampliporus]|nr:hypothetical protein DFH29DRAFT_999987 [Suillus ampliporus]